MESMSIDSVVVANNNFFLVADLGESLLPSLLLMPGLTSTHLLLTRLTDRVPLTDCLVSFWPTSRNWFHTSHHTLYGSDVDNHGLWIQDGNH